MIVFPARYIAELAPFVHTSPQYPNLNGVAVLLHGHDLYLAATDRHRAMIVSPEHSVYDNDEKERLQRREVVIDVVDQTALLEACRADYNDKWCIIYDEYVQISDAEDLDQAVDIAENAEYDPEGSHVMFYNLLRENAEFPDILNRVVPHATGESALSDNAPQLDAGYVKSFLKFGPIRILNGADDKQPALIVFEDRPDLIGILMTQRITTKALPHWYAALAGGKTGEGREAA